ncbi:hypothetical protein GCM10020255_083170 [Rhodococcus baikonurensis]
MARLGIRTTAAAMGAAVLLVTGCSSGDGGDDLITIDPATAAVSPATTSTPDGVVHPYSGLIDSITFDPVTRSAVVVANDPRSVLVVPSDGLAAPTPPRQVVRQPWIPTYATCRSALTVALSCRWIAR